MFGNAHWHNAVSTMMFRCPARSLLMFLVKNIKQELYIYNHLDIFATIIFF